MPLESVLRSLTTFDPGQEKPKPAFRKAGSTQSKISG